MSNSVFNEDEVRILIPAIKNFLHDPEDTPEQLSDELKQSMCETILYKLHNLNALTVFSKAEIKVMSFATGHELYVCEMLCTPPRAALVELHNNLYYTICSVENRSFSPIKPKHNPFEI